MPDSATHYVHEIAMNHWVTLCHSLRIWDSTTRELDVTCPDCKKHLASRRGA